MNGKLGLMNSIKKNLTILNFLDFNSFSSLRYYSYLKNRKLKIFRIGSAGVLQQGSYNKKIFLIFTII